MNLLMAYQKLKSLEPLFYTKEAAFALDVNNKYASVILSRLEKQHVIVKIARGCWAYSNTVDPLLLPNFLAYPMKAYISLYSALYYRGLIEQIPATVFAITNSKTKLFKTSLATISLHSINSSLFSGYEEVDDRGILMATAEKALFDTLYLMPARSHLFKRLTELEIPQDFNFSLIKKWLRKMNNISRRRMVEKRVSDIQKTLSR